MGQGYADDTDDHLNHLNFANWKYKAQPTWDENSGDDGTVGAIGQLNVPDDIMEVAPEQVVQTPAATTVNKKIISADIINLGVLSSLKSNATLISTNFGKTSGSMNSLPVVYGEIIDNDDNASSGTTTAGGEGILDAILTMEGGFIPSPDEHDDKIDRATWEEAATEVEKLGVYANYSNYSNAGYAKYFVYYTNHSNSGHSNYNNHTNYSRTSGSGWWCCYRRTSYSQGGHSNYNNHTNTGNSSNGYSNYNVAYSNYTNNYGDYAKVNS